MFVTSRVSSEQIGHGDSVRAETGTAEWFQEVRDELLEEGISLRQVNDDSAGDLEDRFVELIKETDAAQHKLDELQDQCFDVYGKLMTKANLGTWAAYIGPLDERPVFDALMCMRDPEAEVRKVRTKDLRKDVFQSVFAKLNEAKSDNYYTWLVEFFDLIFVAAVVKIASNTKIRFKHFVHFLVDGYPEEGAPDVAHNPGHHLRRLLGGEPDYNHQHSDHIPFEFHQHHTLEDSLPVIIIDTFVIYFMFFCAFLAHTMLWIRFTDAPGRIDDFLHKIYGFGLVWIALYIPSEAAPFDNCEGLVIGWCTAIGSLVLLHSFYYHLADDVAQEYCKKRMVVFFISIGLSLTSLIHSGADVIFCFFSAMVICLLELNSVRMVAQDVINATTEYLTERLGIFILIILGESILAVILTKLELGSPTIDYQDKKVQEVTWFIMQAFCLTIMLYILYFNGHSSEVEGHHALDNSQFPGAVTWLASHVFLGFALLLLGTTFKLEVYNIEHVDTGSESGLDPYHDRSVEFASIFMFNSLGLATSFIFLIRASHRNYDAGARTFLILRPCLVIWFFILPWFVQTDDPVQDLSIALSVLFIITCVDFWAIGHEWIEEDTLEFSEGSLRKIQGKHRKIKGTLRYMSRSENFARSTNLEDANKPLIHNDTNQEHHIGFMDDYKDESMEEEDTEYSIQFIE